VTDPRKTINVYRNKFKNKKSSKNNSEDGDKGHIKKTKVADSTLYKRKKDSLRRLQERNKKALIESGKNSLFKIIEISNEGIESGDIDESDLKEIKREAQVLLDLFKDKD